MSTVRLVQPQHDFDVLQSMASLLRTFKAIILGPLDGIENDILASNDLERMFLLQRLLHADPRDPPQVMRGIEDPPRDRNVGFSERPTVG